MLQLLIPLNMNQYNSELQFDHSETEGELFDEMDIEATSYCINDWNDRYF